MAYAPHAPLAFVADGLDRSAAPARKGFFARFLAALVASRQRPAEREIARYLAGAGGKFTDETEREIERRFFTTPHQW